MSTEYSVQHAGMAAGIDSLARATQTVNQELDNLEAAVEATLAQWAGDAREQYHVHKAKWNADARRMGELLGVTTQALDQVAVGYQNTDVQNAAGWG